MQPLFQSALWFRRNSSGIGFYPHCHFLQFSFLCLITLRGRPRSQESLGSFLSGLVWTVAPPPG